MTKKEKRHQGILIAGVFFILIIIGLLGFGVLSVISVEEGFSLSVTDYVGTGDQATNTKTTQSFNESISFDLSITNSVNEDDVLLYIVDGSGDKKLLFQQHYDWECDSSSKLVNHPFDAKLLVTHNDYVISLENAITGEAYNYVTKAGDFGEEPYYLEFYVKRARGIRCRVSGISYFNGRMTVDNIILKNTEPTPIIIEEEEPIVNETGNEVTGEVTGDGSSFRPIIAYFSFGAMIALIIGALLYTRKNKKGL